MAGRHPDKRLKRRHEHLRERYGLSPEQYQGMLAAQEGRCAICEEIMAKPQVDHCHIHGNIRALLCFRCNAGLGNFADRPELLKRAAEYVQDHTPIP